MEQAEAVQHRQPANQDEYKPDYRKKDGNTKDWFFGWVDTCMGGENHSTQSQKKEHDAYQMKQLY